MPTKKRRKLAKTATAAPADKDAYWDIDAILQTRNTRLGGGQECLIRWKNYGPQFDSWEPVEHLSKEAVELLKRQQQQQQTAKDETLRLPVQAEEYEDYSDSNQQEAQVDVPNEQVGEEDDDDEGDATLLFKTPQSMTAAVSNKHRQVTIEIPDSDSDNDNSDDDDDDSVVELYTIPSPNQTTAYCDTATNVPFRPEPMLSLEPRLAIDRLSVHDPMALERVTQARWAGIPLVLTGHVGWAQFAARWLDHCPQQKLLDLSLNYKLNVARMTQDLGQEQVPVLSPNYDAHNPISDHVSLAYYLDHCWNNAATTPLHDNGDAATAPLYLHQWQFPLEPSAATKLCGRKQNNPLPVLGDDFLRYWQDEEHMQKDSPLQYIFMGPAQTMSKLHHDTGGLLITIAPIVGTKEVVLVHRSDAVKCLADLEADIDKPDLDQFPLLPFARIYKTLLVPGEILIMPQGTYHQCRNVTPCLSYSRFFLDTVNLMPFFDSFVAHDATEIEHDVVIWNAIVELQSQLRLFVRNRHEKDCPIMARVAKDLQALRQIGQAMYLHYVSEEETDQAEQWALQIQATDELLYDYRFRTTVGAPKFHKKTFTVPSLLVSRRTASKSCASRSMLSNGRKHCLIGESIPRLPKVPVHLQHVQLPESIGLDEGDRVSIRLHGRRVDADILSKREIMQAAYVHYDGFDSFEDEWQPAGQLYVPIPGESNARASFHRLKIGASVTVNERGVHYTATILKLRSDTFYLLALRLGQKKSAQEDDRPITQWHYRESIVEKVLAGAK